MEVEGEEESNKEAVEIEEEEEGGRIVNKLSLVMFITAPVTSLG